MQTQQKTAARGRVAAGDGVRARVLAGVPVTERRVLVAGISTVVLEGGSGPPLVLLHGGIEAGGAYWAPVIARLAETRRVVVPDVPGLGESDPVARLDQAAFDAWFAALLRATCTEPPAVIAHSLLGAYAARFAARHGDLVRRLAIYGVPAIGRYRMPLGLVWAAILFDLRPSLPTQERFERWVFRDLDATRRRLGDWLRVFDEYCVARGAVAHVKRTMRELIRTGTMRISAEDLRRVRVPVVLLWGRHDRMTPLRLAETAAYELGWPLHVIENAGHAPHMEQPGAFVHTLLREVLGRTS